MRNIKQFESFSKEKEIHDICEKYNIKDYTINDDLSIDVKGEVYLSTKVLTKFPLTFNIVMGDFYCRFSTLTSLKGAPRKCERFYCYKNNLTSLEGAPDECIYFECSDNNLISLKGAPRKCVIFICSDNCYLRTLEYITNIDYISIHSTAISSFEYLPNSFRINPNDKLIHICKLICKEVSYGIIYILDEIELFNDYRIIDDKDYVNNKADKATLNMFKLKDFLEELKIDKEIDVNELKKHFYIKNIK